MLNKRYVNYVILACILALALYLRLDNIANAQHWTKDQAYFYHHIMNWFQHGEWPLLGVLRSVGGDRSLGPGWFYTLAPALWLTNFNPATGAAMQGLIGVAAILCYWCWMLRACGSYRAAHATAFIFAISALWVFSDRMLWNCNVIPFAVGALALLIECVGLWPVPSVALMLMLMAILPQWHTVGIPLTMAALPPSLWAIIRHRRLFAQTPRRVWLLWGSALLLGLIALYLPPIIYELGPGPSNMRYYLRHSIPPRPPVLMPLSQRMFQATDRLSAFLADYTFFLREPSHLSIFRLVEALAALACLWVGLRHWFRHPRSAPLSLIFLSFVLGGNWIIMIRNGDNVRDYYILQALVAPVLLVGWTLGVSLRARHPSPLRETLTRAMALFALTLGLTLSALQAPHALAVKNGIISWGVSMRDSRQICEYIINDSEKSPVGLLFVDSWGNWNGYLHVMMRACGKRTTIADSQIDLLKQIPPLSRELMGKRLYVVARGNLNKAPRFDGPPIALRAPKAIGDAWIYEFLVKELPPEVKSLSLSAQAPEWVMHVKTQ